VEEALALGLKCFSHGEVLELILGNNKGHGLVADATADGGVMLCNLHEV
jgi:hypothetical protein